MHTVDVVFPAVEFSAVGLHGSDPVDGSHGRIGVDSGLLYHLNGVVGEMGLSGIRLLDVIGQAFATGIAGSRKIGVQPPAVRIHQLAHEGA